MKIKKEILLFFLISLSSQYGCTKKSEIPDNHIGLKLELQGKKYEKLVLFTQYPTKEYEPWTVKEFEGSSKDGYNWLFIVPDSINLLTDGYNVKVRPFDFQNNRDTILSFTTKELPNGHRVKGVVLEGKETILRGIYRTESSEYFDDMAYLLPDTFVMSPTLVYDIYNVKIDKSTKRYTDMELALLHSDFSAIPKENYNENLQKRVTLVKQYPGSKYLFEQFIYYSKGYKNKTDMKLVFDNFSQHLKDTDPGKETEIFLMKEIISINDIGTLQLRNSKTNQLEPIINDPSKPTLIIFSASWCGPCHKLIPTLKEIYKEHTSSLNIVYISTDKENTIPAWKSLMEKEQIPWRSLLAEDKSEGLHEKYAIKGIPFSIITYKNKDTEVSLWNKEGFNKQLSTIIK